ncbi:MAG: hypothetical protein WBI29_01675 [Candidatus Saccharimonadales bacterium]
MSKLTGGNWCVKNVKRVLISGLLNEQKSVHKIINNFSKNIFCAKKDFIQLVLQTYSKTIYTYIISIFNQLIISFYTISTVPITNTVILNK